MEALHNQLLAAIDKDDLETATHLVTGDIDLNIPCSELQGAPALFFAVLKGNLAMVQLLLEHGADPNYRADEPAASIYTEKPLALARQARMLMNWDQYHPIVQLLEKFGATDEDTPIESPDLLEKSKVEAKRWQTQKSHQ
ncbi:MAG TPA: ankyrin repeat domain-containing protein [Pyrinomonadaceae bacterium]|nr:ankyrin repeat domain-containing protein [Pyrinomonadaceae bacterium]